MPGPRDYRVDYYLIEQAVTENINDAIWEAYRKLRDDPDLERTHYFGGRYENIYIPEQRLPELRPVLEVAKQGAGQYLRQTGISLSAGFWFNEMGPGHLTLPHSHQEDDELVSAVYYVRVPEDSGELILRQGVASTRIAPAECMLVFFAPDVMHEVTENCSRETRLSIGMNFGVRRQ
jgi:hypothetical protein